WHGRVDLHRKGLDVLLDAWAQLVRERTGRDLRLLLIGTGPDAGRLRERLAAPVFEGVHWVDEYILDRDRLRCLLAAADVYAFPSRHEGSPVALMEAMASGFAVAAADAPGVADILGTDDPAGLLVPREDAPALATALGRLLDDDALAQALGETAQHRAEAGLGADAVG